MNIQMLNDMPPVKKCIASHGCGHIYETLKDRCPKCDAEEFENGYMSTRGLFWTTEEREKALSEFRIRESKDWLTDNAKQAGKQNRQKRERKEALFKFGYFGLIAIICIFLAWVISMMDFSNTSSGSCYDCGSDRGFARVQSGIPPTVRWECKSCRAIR